MAKKNKTRRYITARSHEDGREWQYSVPSFVGNVNVGDLVVVGDARVGSFALAEVVSLDPCATHRRENVWPIVDKVKTQRWERSVRNTAVRAQLMDDMAFRQAELDAISRYSESAIRDAEMKELLADYNKCA